MNTLIKYGFIAFVMLSLIGCDTRTHSYDWEWSIEVCKQKKGVRYYNAYSKGCRCNNGEWINRTD